FTTSDNPLDSYYCDIDADNNNQSIDFNMSLFSAGAPAPTKNDVNPLAYTLEVIGSSAKVNGAITSATALVIDNNSGTISVGDIVTGIGISGTVTVASLTDQNNLVLSSAQTLIDDLDLTFTSNVDNMGNSKFIPVSSDGSVVANIDLAAILTDGTIGLTSNDAANNRDEIKYRLTVSSIDVNDPLNTSGPTNTNFGCDNTTTHDFTVFKRQGKPELDLSNQSVDNKLVNEISSDAVVNGNTSSSTALLVDGHTGLITVGDVVTGTGIVGSVTVSSLSDQNNLVLSSVQSLTDDVVLTFTKSNNYLVEYCFGETIQNIKVETENAALPSTIRWYSDDVSTSAAKDVEITVPNGRDVASFILFGTNTPPAGTYVFNLTQTTNILSGTYAGCESDYATLTIVIHDIPNAPRLDLITSSKGDEQTIGGASGGYYAYEYCEGETIENLNILVGGISDSFTANPTLKDNPWIFGSGGSFMGSDILVNAGGTIQSEALIRVNKISFKAKSSTGASTTLEV
ncbi:MAG: hypothetical protein ACKVI9_00360, partial [Gammaproteobacteria bacterium]